jgi:ribonuclease BN (tRNA processing enzyme)
VELVVLGAGGGWARAGGAASGYLLRHEGFDLWIDAGTGTMANLQEHTGLRDVGAVVVSHRHFDHFLDLYPFYLALRYGKDRRSGIPLFAPPGMFEHALQLEGDLGSVFDHRVVEPGATFEAGPFAVRTKPMAHPVPTLGMRISADEVSMAYSADTEPTDRLVELARGTDLLLSEATWLHPKPKIEGMHMTAVEAGELAARAGVDRLLLTHIWPTNDRAVVREQVASSGFEGSVEEASEGMRVRL